MSAFLDYMAAGEAGYTGVEPTPYDMTGASGGGGETGAPSWADLTKSIISYGIPRWIDSSIANSGSSQQGARQYIARPPPGAPGAADMAGVPPWVLLAGVAILALLVLK